MQNVVLDKPYEYVPPHRGSWWPRFIQRFKLIDYWLKKSHGVVDWECRHSDLLRQSLQAGHGVMLTPNHARACDPIVMGWLAREVDTLVYAMASWHLYNQDRFTGFAIQKMGGFSVYREGIDRKAINESISILQSAERPLIVFPEGGVTRTNDRLHALLDGVAFIARSAAKKRAKADGGKVVVHPVAIKYLFQADLERALDPVLTDIERRLSWRPQRDLPLVDRITKVGLTLLALKEIEYVGRPQDEPFQERLDNIIDHILGPLEEEWLERRESGGIIPRVKALRMKILPEMVRDELDAPEIERRIRQLGDLFLAQQISSYPHDYLTSHMSRDRVLETVERFDEDLAGKARVVGPLKAIIDVAPAIEVAPRRDRSADGDRLMDEIAAALQAKLDKLALESPELPLAQRGDS